MLQLEEVEIGQKKRNGCCVPDETVEKIKKAESQM